MFTCLSSRAMHVEATSCLTAHSFIQALRQLTSRSGNARMFQSDNGNNFIGANIELKKEFFEMDEKVSIIS